MERYEHYKDSGIEWLGKIPEEWSCERLKYLATINDEVLPETTDDNFQLKYIDISSVKNGAGIINSENYSFANAPSRARRIVRHGDVIVSTVRTYLKSIAKIENPDENLIVSTGFAVIRSQKIDYNYIGYIFYSEHLIGEIISRSTGVSYPAINALEVGNINIPVPSLDEQINIANYLDHKTAEIDALINQKERLLELYEEEKAAIINHAVTKGIDPDVELVDSGVEWLGEIPKGWAVKRLRYTGECKNGVSAGADYFGSGYPFVSYSDVYKNPVLPEKVEGLAQSTEEDRESYSVVCGDILFTRTSETIDEIGFASTCLRTISDSIFAGFLIRYRPSGCLLHPEFSKYYFRSTLHRRFFVKEMNLVTRASLSQELLKRMPVLLPSIEEQKVISEFLDREVAHIDGKISKTKRIIELQKEYRAALISEVVTGKVKVPDLESNEVAQ